MHTISPSRRRRGAIHSILTTRASSRVLCGLGAIVLIACADEASDSRGGQGGAQGVSCELPTNFTWTSSEELIAPVSDADHDLVSIKDPTIVRFEERWHVFATTANTAGEWSLVHMSFEDWEDAGEADQYYMDQTPGFEGYGAAPHVFYFTPHEKWYLVFQTQPPKYSTTDDIGDPTSWSTPKSFFAGKPRSAPDLWIDYWVICDDAHCYLFFTGDDGALYRSRTTVEDFPEGMDEPVLAMRMSKNELFEGSATYKIEGMDKYLTLVEAIGPQGVRYYKAWTADALDGAWTPLANSFSRPFAGEENVTFDGEAWTRDISHGELLREGYDERMVVDLCGGNLQFLYQGQDFEVGNATSDYSQKPYRLGLLTQGPSDPDVDPLGLPPTPAEPFPTEATGDNLLTNPGFEDGTDGWMAWGASLTTVAAPVHEGDHSGFVSARGDTWNGVAQNIFRDVEPGQSYFASVWVTVGGASDSSAGAGGAGGAGAGGASPGGASGAGAGGTSSAETAQVVTVSLKAVCGDEEIYSTVASGETLPGEWLELSGVLDAPDCEDLAELILYVEGPPAGIDLYVDDASLSE